MPASAKTRPPPRRTGPRKPPPRKQPPWLWFGLGAVVVIALIIAVVASGGSGGSGGSKSSPKVSAGTQQTRPVTVSGTPLPRFTGTEPGATGQLIPDLHGKSFDGTPVNVTRDGRPKLLLVVAHWCPHCQREVPLLAGYLKSNPLPAGVDLITIATATNSDYPNYPPSTWLQSVGWKTPVMADSSDGTAGTALGLPAFPYFVAVDAAGKVVAQKEGEITTADFSQLLQQAMGH